jgi:hypothetical protein
MPATIPRLLLVLVLVAPLSPSIVIGDTFYVSTDGKADGDGSKDKPFSSVEAALGKVGGGHTILVKSSVYRGPIQIARRFAGTKEAPTTIKAEIKWKAIIIGSPGHVISNDDDCHWVTIDGFQVQGARYDGIKMNGDHNVVRNCWVHNNQAMGVAMHNKRHGVIENNLIEFNGSHIQFDHGVYADGDDLVIRGNIVRHNASYGLQLYPSLKNSVIANNVVHGQVRRRGIIVACPKGGGHNRIINNTVVEDPATDDLGRRWRSGRKQHSCRARSRSTVLGTADAKCFGRLQPVRAEVRAPGGARSHRRSDVCRCRQGTVLVASGKSSPRQRRA